MRKAAGDSGEAVQARARYRRDRTRADGKFINIISKLSSVSSGHCQRSRISRHGYGQRCRSTSLKRALQLLVYTVSGLAPAANAGHYRRRNTAVPVLVSQSAYLRSDEGRVGKE